MNRLQCACVFTDGAREVEERLKKFDSIPSLSTSAVSAIKELRAALELLKKDYHEHVTTYNRDYHRSMIELQKVRAINPLGVHPMPTSGWKAGDLKRIREPPPKKKKDEKKSKRTKK